MTQDAVDPTPGTSPIAPRTDPVDALLLLSFGGPEQPEDVLPFLENVTRGRGIPPERLVAVAEHYHHFGGRSPINDQNRALLAAVRADLAAAGVDVPVYWGNRNWGPFLTDTLREMVADGVRHAAVFVTSAYSSYSGCRQYREDLAASSAALISEAGAEESVATARLPVLSKLRHYFDHPGFVEANSEALLSATAALVDDVAAARAAATPSWAVAGEGAPGSRVVFVTHSIPDAMEDSSGPDGHGYTRQHLAAASAILRRALAHGLGDSLAGIDPAVVLDPDDQTTWDLVYCSRSGPPSVPWLEPDVNDHLRALAARGVRAVVLVPIGFVSDHMEVVFDLDTEAMETATELGLVMRRAGTAGTHPAFVAAVRDLLLERAAVERGERPERASMTRPGPMHDVCPVGCCPNLRASKPALCGEDAPAAPLAGP